jgi:hypothetical protein
MEVEGTTNGGSSKSATPSRAMREWSSLFIAFLQPHALLLPCPTMLSRASEVLGLLNDDTPCWQ